VKPVREMSIGELAAYVSGHLQKNGIRAVLSGGACVSIYSENRYQSFDLDFIENISSTRNKLKTVMERIGFTDHHRYYKNPDTQFFVEFPPGPLTVGEEPVAQPFEISLETGTLLLLSPTDCVKDRLAGYYHWKDQPCLEQAILVAEKNPVEISEIRRWSEGEGKLEEFKKIKPLLTKKFKPRARKGKKLNK
jgi:hypothetical protein